MRLKLRSARRLETRINNKLRENIETTKSFNVYQYVTQYTSPELAETVNVEKDWINAQSATEILVDERLDLLEVRYRLRRAIGKANEAFDINEAVAKRKLLLDKLNVVEEVLASSSSEDEDLTVEALQNKLIAYRTNPSLSTFSHEDRVVVPTLRSSYLDSLRVLKLFITKSLEEVEDELLALNTNVTITLNKEDEKLLTKLNLMLF